MRIRVAKWRVYEKPSKRSPSRKESQPKSNSSFFSYPQTIDSLKLLFFQQGITFQQWAKANGYHPVLVSKVLNGAVKARSGKGLEVAVKLGLKAA